MEENDDIFLTEGEALVYLAGLMNKEYFTTFFSGHPPI